MQSARCTARLASVHPIRLGRTLPSLHHSWSSGSRKVFLLLPQSPLGACRNNHAAETPRGSHTANIHCNTASCWTGRYEVVSESHCRTRGRRTQGELPGIGRSILQLRLPPPRRCQMQMSYLPLPPFPHDTTFMPCYRRKFVFHLCTEDHEFFTLHLSCCLGSSSTARQVIRDAIQHVCSTVTQAAFERIKGFVDFLALCSLLLGPQDRVRVLPNLHSALPHFQLLPTFWPRKTE
jgi:hypothetical protein